MTFCRWAALPVLILVVAVVVVACAGAPSKAESARPATVEPDPLSEQDRILDDATLAQQEKDVLFRRRLYQAKALWKAHRLQEALEAADHALLLRPADKEATRFRDLLRRDLGLRDGSVRVLVDEEAARYEARLEEERLSVQRLVAAAEKSKASGNWDEARRDYERALFILRTSRYRENDDYRALRERAARSASNLERQRDSAEKSRRERETAAALREIERQERDER